MAAHNRMEGLKEFFRRYEYCSKHMIPALYDDWSQTYNQVSELLIHRSIPASLTAAHSHCSTHKYNLFSLLLKPRTNLIMETLWLIQLG